MAISFCPHTGLRGVEFEPDGQVFLALNGGPQYSFSEGWQLQRAKPST